MNFFLSRFLIPVLTLAVSGSENWFTSNFSVVGSRFPQSLLLLSWAILIGTFYHISVNRSVGQTTPFLNPRTELLMTDLSACFLLGAALLPYRPDQMPLTSMLHLYLAFSSTVLFFLAVTIADLKLYTLAPDLFSLPSGLLIFAIAVTLCLLILCRFMITSALEIFLTLFSCAWLQIFDRRITIFLRRKRMYFRV